MSNRHRTKRPKARKGVFEAVLQEFGWYRCEHCGEPIRFVTTTTGAKMPVELEPRYIRTGPGAVNADDPKYPGERTVEVYVQLGFVPHWGNCIARQQTPSTDEESETHE